MPSFDHKRLKAMMERGHELPPLPPVPPDRVRFQVWCYPSFTPWVRYLWIDEDERVQLRRLSWAPWTGAHRLPLPPDVVVANRCLDPGTLVIDEPPRFSPKPHRGVTIDGVTYGVCWPGHPEADRGYNWRWDRDQPQLHAWLVGMWGRLEAQFGSTDVSVLSVL